MRRLFLWGVIGFLFFSVLFSCSGKSISITSLDPTNRLINSVSFVLTVNGSNFSSNSVVIFDDSQLQTTYVSDSQLTAVVETASTQAATGKLQSSLSALPDKSVKVYVKDGEEESNKMDFILYSSWTFTDSKEVASDQSATGDHQVLTDDLDGNLYSVWQKLDPYSESSRIYFSKSSNSGTSWSSPLDVSGDSFLKQYGQLSIPNLCIDNQDVLRIIWTGGDVSSAGIFNYVSLSSNKGSSFSDPVRITSDSASYKASSELMPSVYVEPETSIVHAAWIAVVKGYSGSCVAYSKAVTGSAETSDLSSSGFAAPKIIESGLNTQPLCFKIAADKTGRIHIVWLGVDRTDGEYKLYIASSLDYGESWSKPKVLTSQYVVGGTSAGFSMAMDANGYLYVVYTGALTQITPWNIYFMKSTDNGATFSSPRDLTASLNYCHTPYIMCDTVNNLSITYQLLTTAKGGFYCIRSYDGGTTFTDPYPIAESATSGLNIPSPFSAASYTRSCRIIPAWNSFKGIENGHIVYDMYYTTSRWSR